VVEVVASGLIRLWGFPGQKLYYTFLKTYVILTTNMEYYSLYLHIPFCRKRCSYCDFNTYAGQESWISRYVDALCREIDLVAASAPEPISVHTIFFGGGTPSLITVPQYQQIFQHLRKNFWVIPEAEISLEANPGTVSPEYLSGLRETAFNRISFGMQSANSEELRLLQRVHNADDAGKAVHWARKAGFNNLNLDLIFGLPGQKLVSWQETVEYALQLGPDHLSLYALTVEPGTLMHNWVTQNKVSAIDDDLAADMYEWSGERLEAAGFKQYEISNWARLDSTGILRTCRHNLQYWKNQPYLGFGAGAHGYSKGTRTANVNGIPAFVKRCTEGQAGGFPVGPALEQAVEVNEQDAMQETMMVGLRLTEEGVSRSAFEQRFGQCLEDVFRKEIRRLLNQGLLEWALPEEDHLRLTRRGRLLGNQVFMQFVGD
jgi:oxygen-independent coproporphyrinogen III oxidase